MSITIIIITKNEAFNIADCIKSASFANEILVIDSGSKDLTVPVARGLGAKVICTDWPGDGPQRNRGIDAAKNEWLFCLDADERITPELAREIIDITSKNSSNFFVYDVPRKSYFVRKFMSFSGWWPDRTRRLFKNGYARYTIREMHANLKTKYPVGNLKNYMIHYSYRTIDEVLNKIHRYSTSGAIDLKIRNKEISIFTAIFHGFWAFIKTYFIKLGFLDGVEGFVLAVANSQISYYKYLKYYYQQVNKKR